MRAVMLTSQLSFLEIRERSRHQDLSSQKFTNTRPSRSIGYPMITLITAQEMRDAIQFDEANHWIDESIEQIVQFHFKPEHRCVVETVALDGEIIDHFDKRTLNPEHAIEASWFIMQEGMYRKDQGLMNSGHGFWIGCGLVDGIRNLWDALLHRPVWASRARVLA